MYKMTRTFTDFNGETRTEDFYFNLTRAEIAQMSLSTDGGLDKLIERITQTKDVPKIAEYFKKIMDASYGERTPDGRGFRKSPEILADFQATMAYSDLYMELLEVEGKAAEFINKVIEAPKAVGTK